MIDPAKVRLMALTAAVEDCTGLYEVIWELNGKYPSAAESEKLEAAQVAVRQLFDEGFIELFFAVWSPYSYDPIEGDGAEILTDAASWRPPSETPGATYFAFAATESGKNAYFSLSAEDFDRP